VRESRWPARRVGRVDRKGGRMSLIEPDQPDRPDRLPRSTATNAYDLLGDVITCIQHEPRRCYMKNWITPAITVKFETDLEGPPCGTAACVAGWICLLADGRARDVLMRACALLNVDSLDVDDLFWGTVMSRDNGRSLSYGDDGYVPAVMARIEAFRATHRDHLTRQIVQPQS
jgi:hypothetical protein